MVICTDWILVYSRSPRSSPEPEGEQEPAQKTPEEEIPSDLESKKGDLQKADPDLVDENESEDKDSDLEENDLDPVDKEAHLDDLEGEESDLNNIEVKDSENEPEEKEKSGDEQEKYKDQVDMPSATSNSEKDNKQEQSKDKFAPAKPTTPERNAIVAPKIKVMYNKNHLPTDIREDEYYYEWVEEILEGFPNRGPPYTPCRLSNHLYIGSLVNAEDENLLKRLGITHVLNCAGTRRFDLSKSPYDPNVGVKEYIMIPAEDFEDYNIVKHFNNAFAFIERCKKAGGKCLVHCNLGVNRSGAVCAGYLMMSDSKSLLQVIDHLKKARQVILTNRGFRYQLINYARARNFLDPIIQENGFPATIPPPLGNSKFSRNARRQPKSKTQAGTSDVPPSRDFLDIDTSGANRYGSSSPSLRPKDPPVSSRSFTRSSSAMGVQRRNPRHKAYSWTDQDIEDYMDDDGLNNPKKYTSSASYRKAGITGSGSSRPASAIGCYSDGLSSSSYSSSHRAQPVYTRSSTVAGYGYSSDVGSSYDKPYNILNLLSRSKGYSSSTNGLGATNGYSSEIAEPYHTLTISSPFQSGGFSFNVPKPPFGTSRRRFGPAKGLSFNNY